MFESDTKTEHNKEKGPKRGGKSPSISFVSILAGKIETNGC